MTDHYPGKELILVDVSTRVQLISLSIAMSLFQLNFNLQIRFSEIF